MSAMPRIDPMTRSASVSTVLAVFLLTSFGVLHDAQAAKRKKHHKGHAPSGGKASAPDTGDESPSGGESESGAAPEAAERKPAPEPEAAPPAEDDSGGGKHKKKIKMEGEASSGPTASSGLPWLDLSLGVSLYNRNLSFHQDADPQGSQLSPYSLPAWPVGQLSAVLYLEPLVAALGNLGLEAHAMQGFGVSSKFNSSSNSFTSTVHDYSGGARYRFPFGSGNAFFVSARYGEDAFTFHGSNRTTLLTPDTIYHYLRGGLGVQWALGPSTSLSAGAGYRYVTNKAGPYITGAFFPRLAVAGADAQVALTYAISDIYALRAGVDWRRYWFDFHVRQGDNYLVGGAVDQSFLFTVSLVLTIGGSSGEHAEAEEAPAKKPDKATKPKSDEGGDSGGSGGSDSDEGTSHKSGGGDDI